MNYNKQYYDKNKDALKERTRVRRRKQKTFNELLNEFANNIQLAETAYLESVVERTKLSALEVVSVYKKLCTDMKLTEHQRLHIHNNIPVKKLLNQRLQAKYEIGDLL
ncbi:hypothetical protein BCT19_01280 [Vibrio splendidus]|uniref:hypothetical protein n=1 Tax=Vibrio splendidus TaxID=29497 RepID=UPI000C81DCCA|nr:hypothetical protein [Vibrio splendidus]PMO04344.1 hypothetical protein BCT19_01280 [Vibrio splendidus]